VGVIISTSVQTSPGAQPTSCTLGTGSFPGVKSSQGVTLIPHPLLVCGHERVELYLYSPYGPYSLYKGALYLTGHNVECNAVDCDSLLEKHV